MRTAATPQLGEDDAELEWGLAAHAYMLSDPRLSDAQLYSADGVAYGEWPGAALLG